VLNAYAGARRTELAAAWNWHPRLELADDPKIAHWAGPLKPWGAAWVNGKDLWREAEARLTQRLRRSPASTSAR
jgi:lipopolysaccharide biosynthesis glycosyltransferase